MLEIIIDTLNDGIKLLPFLFVTFLLMELLEHKIGDKSKEILVKTKKVGPIIGSLFSLIPQCGISAGATNLYITRVISLGTLISIYLTTSDEMLPILISNQIGIYLIFKILLIKFICGFLFGYLIDFIYRKKEKEDIKDFCIEEDCDCSHGILKSSIKHTFNVFIYILLFSFVLNVILKYFGESKLESLLLKNSPFGVILTSLIGLIPNCSSSILLTELFLNNYISVGKLLSGLLVNSGVGLLILLKYNKNKKENLKIILILLIIGIVVGLLFDLLKVTL